MKSHFFLWSPMALGPIVPIKAAIKVIALGIRFELPMGIGPRIRLNPL